MRRPVPHPCLPTATLRACRFGVLAVLLAACGGEKRDLRGLVFVDADGDGTFSQGDSPLPGGHLFHETRLAGTIDATGRYDAEVEGDGSGILWVRPPPEVADPGPFWIGLSGEFDQPDIPVRPRSGQGEFTFVVASDTHAGIAMMDPADQLFGLLQATAIDPRPYFITVTGDITQSNKPEQFSTVTSAIAEIEVPYVPVPGNHDWYDGGAMYRQVFGPPNYAFDSGGLHFIVLNDADSLDTRLAFVDADLALVSGGPTVVVMLHAPPVDELLAGLEARGVDVILSGHMHSNRVMLHEKSVEYNTQPLVMGGMDLTPGGFRVFSLGDDGQLRSYGRTTVNWPVMRLVAPAVGQVAPECKLRLIAAVEPGVAVREVSATVDGGEPLPLRRAGGWDHVSDELKVCEPGPHDVRIEAMLADGSTRTLEEVIEVGPAKPVPEVGNWPMFQGNLARTGASETAILPPLRTEWVSAVGGHIHGGSPVASDGRVFVPVSDFGEGAAGGLVALDAATGAALWEARVGSSVRNAATVADGVVVFLSNDGVVHALEADTGRSMWSYELAAGFPQATRSAYSSPAVADGIVYAGVRREIAAFDLRTGTVQWSHDPIGNWGDLASHVSPAIEGDALVVSFDRALEGLIAFDRSTGGELWRTNGHIPRHMHASPVVGEGAVFVINELTQLTALDLADGAVRWQRQLNSETFEWGYLSAATPAHGAGMLFVGLQQGQLIALESGAGQEIWRTEGNPSIIRATHYHGELPAFSTAPVITPGVLWVGSPDGLLRAIDPANGELLWSQDLGVPITSSPAPAGPALVVATFDGTVRMLRPEPAEGAAPSGGM